MPSHLSCVLTMGVVTPMLLLCLCAQERNSRMFISDALCFSKGYDLFRTIVQNNSMQHTTIRSAFESFVPSCPVTGNGRPCLVVVVHDTSDRKWLCPWLSTVAEAVGVKGICSAGSVSRCTRCPTMYAVVSGSSLCSSRTKHTPA